MGSIEEISQLCRLCLIKDQVNVPIFDETSDINETFVKINSCLPVKVSPDDNLPKKICDGCSYKLDMLYIFRNTSAESEQQLVAWLDEAGLASCGLPQTSIKESNTKSEILVKQEAFEATDPRVEDDTSDAHSYILQQQKLPYQQEFTFVEATASGSGLVSDEPPLKRPKRAAALKKISVESEDLEATMQITKAEDDDSDDADQPDYIEAPSTSADDQPGPSGVEKGTIDAPDSDVSPNVEEFASAAIGRLKPKKPRSRFPEAYKMFESWCELHKLKAINEKILLTYFESLATLKTSSSETLWSTYTMLKAEFAERKNIDIEKYTMLLTLLERQTAAYTSKKSKLFTKENVESFIKVADDKTFLFAKVAMVIGIAGACGKTQLMSLRERQVSDKGTFFKIHIPQKKTRVTLEYVITAETISGVNVVDLVRKYKNMRPKCIKHDRFFVEYFNGKCGVQPVGIRTFAKLPTTIAQFLGLPDPRAYTEHCFRKSSASVLAESRENMQRIEKYESCKSSPQAEAEVEAEIEIVKKFI